MISTKSLAPAWLDQLAASNPGMDKIRAEKLVRALLLLEGLSSTDIEFVVQADTARILMLDSIQLFSGEVNILIAQRRSLIYKKLEPIVADFGFTKMVLYKRCLHEEIPKLHLRFYYESIWDQKRNNVVLTILLVPLYYFDVVDHAVESPFVQSEGYSVRVPVPSYEDLLGEKMADFALGMAGFSLENDENAPFGEWLDKLVDLALLFDKIKFPDVVRATFYKFILLPCDIEKTDVPDLLQNMIQQIVGLSAKLMDGYSDKRLVISLEDDLIRAAKVAYLAKVLQVRQKSCSRYIKPMQNFHRIIKHNAYMVFSPLKDPNPEAFFYWCKLSDLEA